MPTAWAPGRVNLIGEHTDYTGGLVLPMAIDLGVTLQFEPLDGRIELTSVAEPDPVTLDLPVDDPSSVDPPWARYVAGVAAELGSTVGVRGTLTSTLPIGAGLSSSAALELAVAIALRAPGSPLEIATACRAAEESATGVPCGIMDQLTSAAGIEGHALLIDCRTGAITPTRIPDDIDVVVIHSGQRRSLVGSAYTERRAQCAAAEAVIGPLRDASLSDLPRIEDLVVRARARHVISENRRVVQFADALHANDLVAAGELMVDSHRSLRDDFEVSTDVLDGLVQRLLVTPDVHGARLTGAGFGGCVVALCEPGALAEGWTVTASAGARLLD
jgi:galactokinase